MRTTGKIQRNTKQRKVILEELKKLTSHPTAADLYEIVRQRLPKISLGTVYRNLELLARNNTIQKLHISGTKARFDANPDAHNHIRCTECGLVSDLYKIPADPISNAYKDITGWEILGYRLEFIGICPQCRRDQLERQNLDISGKKPT
jgi:Fe2+ or Zn2+ uptake regulation protein